MKSKKRAAERPIVIDLCSGMGGLSLSAEQLSMQVIAGVDLNSDALRTYDHNFEGAESIHGCLESPEVTQRLAEIVGSRVGNRPLIVLSGPPCQGFSVAGTRDPNDPRNQVLLAVARTIAKLSPECALVENVSTILSPVHSDRLSKFRLTLRRAGFFVQAVLLNAAEFGVPQRRKRVFFFITKIKLSTKVLQYELETQKQPMQTVGAALLGLPTPLVRPTNYDDQIITEGVANHFAMQHSEKVKTKIAALAPGTGPMSYRKLHPSRPSNTLFSGHRAPPAHHSEARSITVREAARLQGFPDSFRIYGSFGNQMQQVTNAVPPPLARAVLLVLCRMIGVTLP